MSKYFFALLAIAIVPFTGCGNDDDSDGSTQNQFTFNGTSYNIANGFLEEFGSNGNGSFDWDVYLVSSGISVSGADLTGTGDLVYLDLNTDSSEGLVEGTYNFSNDRDNLTIVDGTVGVDFDLSGGGGTFAAVTGGTVTVDIDGNQTTISFNLTTNSGGNLTGNWRGTLQRF
ncbi:MAG: hypothetical protein AAFY36_02300 [Bacteroidota bacterium]